MGEPLTVARADIVANQSAVDVAEVGIETGIPASLPFHMLIPEIRNFFHGAAEAGRADHGAIRAGETALACFLPARMFQLREEQIAEVGRLHVASDLVDRALPGGFCRWLSSAEATRPLSLARTFAPRSVPTSTMKASGSSVRAKSKPWRHRGPVFMDVQKQVLAACVQFTAIRKAPSRRP